jgi:hypothetical protein
MAELDGLKVTLSETNSNIEHLETLYDEKEKAFGASKANYAWLRKF